MKLGIKNFLNNLSRSDKYFFSIVLGYLFSGGATILFKLGGCKTIFTLQIIMVILLSLPMVIPPFGDWLFKTNKEKK